MKKIYLTLLSLIAISFQVTAQGAYDSYVTGDDADVDVDPDFGVVLMGGAGENDEAMKWFLERANGGDVVVLRASGSDGYNDYFFSDLGVTINSVESIVFNNASAAEDPYVIEQVQNAEAIWMAGGNQWNYVNYWQGTAIEDAINNLLNVRTGVVGGISAGMAVMGGSYFNAQNGSVYSDEALEDPYNQYMTIGHGDFIEAPYMENVITDTHYDDPDRTGRHTTFLARIFMDQGSYPLGIACDEYGAVCVDEDGRAWCYGEAPTYDDYIYFLRPDCGSAIGPEVCEAGQPLTWNDNGAALKVLRVWADLDGEQYLDLNDWETHEGGEWFDWVINKGDLVITQGDAPDCAVGVDEQEDDSLSIYPNPANQTITIQYSVFTIYNSLGEQVYSGQKSGPIDISQWADGVYVVHSERGAQTFIKQ